MQNINQEMALIEGELEENVKKFPVLFDKSNYDFHGKDRKTAWTKLLNLVE